jgi:hypothetical protein
LKKLILFFAIVPYLVLSQGKLKKKFRRNYIGSIAAYDIKLGDSLRHVSPSKIRVQLTKDSLFLNIDRSSYASAFQIFSFDRDKKYLRIKVQFAPNSIPEYYYLNKRTRTLYRKGIFPSPDVELVLEKK